MKRLQLLLVKVLLAAGALLAFQASAAVVFSDQFDDCDVSDWTMTTNFSGGITSVTATTTAFVSAPCAMHAYLQPVTGSGTNLYVYASHDFTVVQAGAYALEFQAKTAPCSGCTISYDALLDSTLLQRGQSPFGFTPHTIGLGSLSAGVHSVTLGMFTTAAFSGPFPALFDDVTISSVPETGTLALLSIGLAGIMRQRHALKQRLNISAAT